MTRILHRLITPLCALFLLWSAAPFAYEIATGTWAPHWLDPPWFAEGCGRSGYGCGGGGAAPGGGPG